MIEDILMQASMLQLEESDLNKEQIESARATVTQIAGVMTEYREARGHIAANGRLSPEGKQTDLADLQTTTDNRLAQIVNPRLDSLEARIAELEFQTRPQQPDTDPVLELLRQQEVRTMLAKHHEYRDELQLRAYYNELAISGENDLVMRSIEQSPIPLISDPSILEAGKRARGERTNADAARTLRQLRSILSTIQSAFVGARAELNLPDLTLTALAEAGAA